MQYSYVHDNGGGHAVKSRAERNEIYYNWIESPNLHAIELIGPDPGSFPNSMTLAQVEAVAREDSDVVGNVIRKKSTETGHLIRIGSDETGRSKGRYRFVNNTFITSASPNTGSAIRVYDEIDSLEVHNSAFFRPNGGSGQLAIELVRTSEAIGSPQYAGSNNCFPAGSTLGVGVTAWTGSKACAQASFIDYPGNDLRPSGASLLLNAGVANPPTIAARPFPSPLGTPLHHPPVRNIVQSPSPFHLINGAAIDIGAFEAGLETTPPTVMLTAPAANFIVTGPVTITATADDASGVSGVRFLLDGVRSLGEDTSAPYQVTWTPTSVPDDQGSHFLVARARDGANIMATSAVVPITVNTSAGGAGGSGAGGAGGSGAGGAGGSGAGGAGGSGGSDGANLIPDPGFETSTGGGSVSALNYVAQSPGQSVTSDATNPIAGAKSLHLVFTGGGMYAEWHYRQAGVGNLSGTLTARGTLRNNGSGPNATTVRLSVGYSDAGWGNHVVGTDYTLQPNETIQVSGSAPVVTGSTQLVHWITCSTPGSMGGCNVSWDTAYVGFGDTTAPTVTMTAPASGASVSGATTISANANDNVAVTGVQFLMDGANLQPEDTTNPYSVVWDTSTASPGTHTLAARARDAAGNTTTSPPITVTLGTSNPCSNPTNIVPDGCFESGTGGGGVTALNYASSQTGQSVTSDAANPIEGAKSLHLVLTGGSMYAEWHYRQAGVGGLSGTLTAKGTLRNNGSGPNATTVRLSVGYSDAGWGNHVVGTDYTLQPDETIQVSASAPVVTGSTQLLHWITCSTPGAMGGCNVSWDKAYVGFSPPP